MKNILALTQPLTNRHTKCPQPVWGDLQMRQTPFAQNSIKDVSAGVGQRSSLRLFLCLHCPSFFFSGGFFPPNKIQSERIAEGSIRSYVWRLVKERRDERVCVCVLTSMRILWPFVDSWRRVNVIMTSRDAICFLGSCSIQLLWGSKRSTAKQHQQTVQAF